MKNYTGRRTNGFFRLVTLHTAGLLNIRQQAELAKALYQIKDQHGFPAQTDFLKFSFINIPHPADVDPIVLFKQYILAYTPSVENRLGNDGIGFTRGENQTLKDLVSGSRRLHYEQGVTWTYDEAGEIFHKMNVWWDTDKQYLLWEDTPEAFGNVPQEFRNRFLHLTKVLNEVLSRNDFWRNDANIRDTIRRMITEMMAHGLQVNNLKFSYIELFPEFRPDLLQQAENSLASNDSDRATDAFNMIIDLTANTAAREVFVADSLPCLT